MDFFLGAWIGYYAPSLRRACYGAFGVTIFMVLLDGVILRGLDFFPQEVMLSLWLILAGKVLAGASLAHWAAEVARSVKAKRAARAAAAAAPAADDTHGQDAS